MEIAMKALISVLLFCLVVGTGFAADSVVLATPGKVAFEDDFARSELAPKWRVGKGAFTVKDGVVSAAEIPEDKHGAYAYIKPGFEFKDIVIEYSAKFDGRKACH